MSNDHGNDFASNLNQYIIGADEVGTGACAGGAFVCAVRAAPDWNLEGLADSKKLQEKKRISVGKKILEQYKLGIIRYSLLEVTPKQIDDMGLGEAIKWAHQTVINNLVCEGATAILDGKIKIQAKCDVTSIIKADTKIPTVMAASILAKNYRDAEMRKLHAKYPEYGWDKNVGYIVPQHKEAIKKHGLSPLHRKSYKLKDI